jgi:glycosyltransferase involved in cell wall biosynthesis
MKILIPDICVPNTYVHDLAFALTSLGHEIIWGSDNFFYGGGPLDVILSQWPEGYFRNTYQYNPQQPKQKDLQDLEIALNRWREKSLILSFIHNTEPRGDGVPSTDIMRRKLFKISYTAAHGFVHLGRKSIIDLESLYSPAVYRDKPSLVISHGLNELLKVNISNTSNITPEPGCFRIFVPGTIRSWLEIKFLLLGFSQARIPRKKLVIAGSGSLFDGKHPLKKIRKFLVNSKLNVLLLGHRQSDEEIYQEIIAADILIAPRLWATNSGIPYLAATFGKRCICPAVGNIPEAVNELNGISFEPNCSSSLAKAIETAYEERDLIALPELPCPSWHEIAKQLENFVFQFKIHR